MSERVVLCEGYHDRAFWAGLLLRLNCGDLAPPPPNHRAGWIIAPIISTAGRRRVWPSAGGRAGS